MINDKLQKNLNIRYLKLRVDIRIKEKSVLPKYKVSAIRGGIGDAMLRLKCGNDGKCDGCPKESECDVRNFMYAKFNNAPPDMKTNMSVGYVIECENFSEDFDEGDELKFYIILFGDNITRIRLCKEAIREFGKVGIGVRRVKFDFVGFKDDDTGLKLLEDTESDVGVIKHHLVTDYVEKRLRTVGRTDDYMVYFKTGVTIKEKSLFLRELTISGLCNSLLRRIYMLDMYEGIANAPLEIPGEYPEITDQSMQPVVMPRFSNAKQQKMYLSGMRGKAVLTNVSEEWLTILLAGELLHVGKNTSFGFGRYIVKNKEELL